MGLLKFIIWKHLSDFLCQPNKADLLDILLGLLLFEMKVEGKSFVWQFTTWEAEGGCGLDSIYIARGTWVRPLFVTNWNKENPYITPPPILLRPATITPGFGI